VSGGGPGATARFERFYRRHWPTVDRFVRRRVDPADADDVVAEVFLTAWRRLDEVPTEPQRAAGWLIRTAGNVIANARRTNARRRRLIDRLGGVHPARGPVDPEEAVAELTPGSATAALRTLRAEDQAILLVAAYAQPTAEELATVLGCSTGAARVRLSRARARFRLALARAEQAEARGRGDDPVPPTDDPREPPTTADREAP